MSRPIGMNSLFGPRSNRPKKAALSRKRRNRHARQFAAPESLERRAMLAFSTLPVPGLLGEAGNPIVITTDGTDALHEISIILDDVINPGFVTATITTKVNGLADQVGQYFDFGDISFTAVNDRDGSVVNKVSLWTSYEVNLLGREVAPSGDADVGLSTNWLAFNQFPPGISTGTTVIVDLLNADALTVTGGVLGGGDSTIAGEFESPTLPANMDPTKADTYANISLFSGVGIADDRLGDPIVATALTLKSQTGGINLSQDVFTRYDLSMEAAQDIELSGLVEVQEGDVSLVSTSGSIAVLELVHAMAGSITIDSDCDEVEIERLCAFEDITINAPQGVVVFEELRSETGGVTITADAGPMQIRDIFSKEDIQLSAGETITLTGLLEATFGAISVGTSSGAVLLEGAQLHALDNKIDVKAHSRILQDAPGGLIGVTVLAAGRLGGTAGDPFPQVSVEFAPPAGGGVAATGQAVVVSTPAPTVADPAAVVFSLAGIILTNRGSGYAINEATAIQIRGMPGAVAVSVGPRWAEHITAKNDITLGAGTDVKLVTVVRSDAGTVTIRSIDGDLDLSEPGQLVHAVEGSIAIESKAGSATVTALVAGRDIAVTSQGLATLSGDVLAKAGKIDVTSTAGAINLTANLAAAAGVTLDAAASVIQPSASGISSLTLSAGGSGYDAGAVVTIAPPAGGGTAARATAVVESGVVTAVIITSAGNGYAVGESPLVTITGNLTGGGEGAPAREAGSGAAAVAAGPTAIPGITGSAITVRGDAGVTLSSFVIAENGAIVVDSSSGGLSLDSGSVLLQAEKGSVTLNADAGSVSVRNVLSRDTIDVAGFSAVSLAGEIRSVSGDIEAVSLAGSILLAANLKATSGKMDFEAHGSITQASESGLSGIELITGGTGYTLGATVTIAAPIGGGVAAKAVATLENGVVTGLTLTDAGSGYAVGENPAVTISGGATAGAVQGSGAAARAFGPVAQQQVRAGNGIQFKAGTGIALRSNIVSDKGDITATTRSGNLNLDSGALTLQALGGNLQLTSDAGVVSAQRLLAEQDITIKAYSNASVIGEGKAGSDVIVTSDYGKASVTNLFAGDAITVSGRTAVSLAGEIDAGGSGLTAKSSAGTVQFSANLKAENGKIELEAAGSVNQLNSTGISAITLRSGGSGYTLGAKVTVAPPSAGGTAATAEAVVEFGVVTSIIITQPGSGYAVGESPAVTITGNLSAAGGGPNPAPPAPVGGGASAVAAGPLTAPRVVAGEQIKVVGNTGVSLNSLVDSKNILVESAAGVLSLDAASLKMKAQEAITLKTELGAIAAGNLYGGAVTVTAAGNLSLAGEILSDSTGLKLESSKGAVTLGANLRAESGSISVKSAGSLVQAATGGLSGLQLTAGGSGYTSRVVVTIAPPQGDGVAAQAAAVVTDGAITGLILTSPGSGYAVGETPAVTFAAGPADGLNPGGGGAGASARAIGPVSLPQIFATDDIAIESGASATLTTLVRSTGGDVSIRAKTGDLALDAGSFAVVTESAASTVALEAETGSVNLRRIDAAGSINVFAGRSVSVSAMKAEGAVTIDASTGVTVEQRVESGGKASISALNGSVTVGDVFADNGIDVKAGAGFLVQRVLRSDKAGISIETAQDIALGTSTTDSSVIALGGDITAKTKASGIALDARLVATGQIDLGAQGAVTQAFGTGVIRFEIVNGGLSRTLPTVTLTVAGPAAGGEAATATAVVGSRQVGTDSQGLPVFNYFIESILVTNVGRGYAVGENPIVTVTGIDGAVIQAFGPVALRTLEAGAGVKIAGGDDVILVNTVTASAGDIAVSSVSGNLRLGADTFLANAVAGSVTLKSDAGTVVVERMFSSLDSVITGMKGVTVERDLTAGRDITVTAAAGPATVGNLTAGNAITVTSQGLATVSGDVVAKAGAIGVVSTAGGIDLTANVLASTGSVTLTSNLGLLQTVSSGVTDIVLLNGGRDTGAAPTVTVTIAPPADPRGVAATASARIAQVGTDIFDGPIWSITQIVITSPGSGYAAGESPQVTIAGMPNAAAQAIVRNAGTVGTIVAERDLTVVAGGDVEAVATFRANTGDVSIRSIAGSLVLGADTFLANAVAGSVTLQSDAGTVAVERILSGRDSVITGTKGVTVERSTVAGRDIAVAATAGPATVTDLTAGRALAVTSNGLASLNGDVVATAGAITVTSTSNAIDLRANMNAAGDSISLTANLGVVQSVNSGVSRVTLVSGGQSVGATPPTVTVTIAGPAAGGTVATAEAVIAQAGQTGNIPLWTITQIIITNPGSGYAINESPLVTITGMPGAAAGAFARTSDPAVVADDNVTVKAGGDVTLVSPITATKGDIGISSTTGDLLLGEETFIAHAVSGSIALESKAGSATVQQLTAGTGVSVTTLRDATLLGAVDSKTGSVTVTTTSGDLSVRDKIHAQDGSIALAAKGGQATVRNLVADDAVTVTGLGRVTVSGEVTANTGDVKVTSTSGAVSLAANIHARDERIVVTAHGELQQAQAGGLVGIERVEGGRFTGVDVPEVTITIAGPVGGGAAATAVAVIEVIEPAIPPSSSGGLIPIVIPGTDPTYAITSIILTNAGSGYAIGELPVVTITGMPGAVARAVPSTGSQSLVAGKGITLAAGDDVTLTTTVRSNMGDVSITSIDGDLDLSQPGQLVHAVEGNVLLSSTAGGADVRQVRAGGNVDVTTLRDVNLFDRVASAAGDVAVVAASGSIGVLEGVRAASGRITLTAGVGSDSLYAATVRNLEAGDELSVVATGGLAVRSQTISTGGDISLASLSDSVDLRTANIHAMAGGIKIAAHGGITQYASSGVQFVEVTEPGVFIGNGAERPDVDVTIAGPLAGGEAAEAVVGVEAFGVVRGGNGAVIPFLGGTVVFQEGDNLVWRVSSVTITSEGTGYGPLESPKVTFEGDIDNAAAVAYGPSSFPTNIVADGSVDVTAGEGVLLATIVRSNKGDVTIASIDGDLNLSADKQLVHAVAGSVTLETLAGGIEYQRIIAAQDITLRSHETLTIDNQLTTNGGDVTLASTGNNVALTANVLAADRLAISAKSGIAQTAGTVKATELYAENLTPTAITLAAAGNDVERFAAKNAGNITFNDANDFRVGLKTSGTMGVEVTGDNVNLTAAGTIRAVAGIRATKLTMTADTVELVTTNAVDNHTANAAFAGTLRDMISLSNANTNRTSNHEFVFDEPGYSVSEVNVRAALPALTRRATIDGSTATGGRLGISGTTGVASGVRFGAGSLGSSLTTAALYGFSSGSAFVIESSGNSISDLWFGLRADGSAGAANRVGLNVTGGGAFGNVIGSALEFDPLTANRFAGHTDAAIVVQRGASNNLVAGNLVGVEGRAANRTGIRIDGASGTRIGTPDQVTGDLTPTPSNRIVGNTHYGIEVRNVRGATTLIENNVVSGNAGPSLDQPSGAHGIGVLNSAFVQIGGSSELSRNQVFSNLGGSGIHLSGSNNIRIQGNVIGADGYHLSGNAHTNDAFANRPDLGNGMHGIHVFGRSRDVLIDANRIVDNSGSGVAIASGSSAVNLTNNEIGVWVHPVTGNVHAAGNDADGVTVTAANGNTIGAGNRIGFNAGSGVRVENSVAAGLATGNRVTGAELFGNLGHGVHLTGSSRQTIGGSGTGAGNVVMQNTLDGIRIETDPRIRASAAPQGNVVAGNFVGTNSNEEIDRGWGNRNGISVMNGVGTVLSGNVVMNNRESGIEVSGGSGATVGGNVETAGNFVGYNLGDGIFIHDQASTNLPVGVVGTTITNGGAGYSASRTTVIFTAPAASGGVAARGVAIISAAGRVTGIQLTSKGSGYVAGEPVTVTIFDPQATVQATATVSLGAVEAVSQVTRGHVVSGNEIEANTGAGIYVKGDRTTQVQIGQDFDSRTGRGLPNKLSFHEMGVLVDAASRVSVQGNSFSDNGVPLMMINGANRIPGAELIEVIDLKSVAWGRGQTRVTGTVINGGAFHEYWVDVYATPSFEVRDGEDHQMRTFLGRTVVTTDRNGRAALSLTVSESMQLGDRVSVKLTSNRYEDGSTVGVWHSDLDHGVDLTAAPTTSTTPTTSGGSTSTGGRGPVPVR